MWQDFVIDRRLSDDDVASGFSRSFGVAPETVMVLRDLDMLARPELNLNGVTVICTCIDLCGDFVMSVEVILRTPELDALVAQRGDLPLLQELCEFWNVEGLADDGSPSATSWLHLRPGQSPEQAYIDPDQLDDHDAFVLIRESVATAD
jgi:hypothetical protein